MIGHVLLLCGVQVAENEQLITECNTLRKEMRELRTLLDKAQNELATGVPGTKPGLASRRKPAASQGLLRPSTAGNPALGSVPLGSSLPGAGGGLGGSKGSSGTLLKGSAGVMGRERARTAEVLMTLEANQREMQMQRAEILRLREQVQMLSGGAEGADGSGSGPGGAVSDGAVGRASADEQRPVSSQDRPIKHSPVLQPPRAASALD